MKNELNDEALLAKVESLFETVDAVKDVDRDLASDIAISELSGTKLPERYRKLAILIHRQLITDEESRRVVSLDAKAWDGFFDLLAVTDVPDDFLSDRDDSPPQERLK